MGATTNRATDRELEQLRRLIAGPNFARFREEYDRLAADMNGRVTALLAQLGAEAFETFLAQGVDRDPSTLAWFIEHAQGGRLELSVGLAAALRRAQRTLARDRDRRRHGKIQGAGDVIHLKRVVQLSWFGFAGFDASDAFAIRRSVFRSPQERTFARALSLRFPGLSALPNYPLDQIADLERLRTHVPEDTWKYARWCRIDAVLVTPVEGDPVAAFELDSAVHERPEVVRRDRQKAALLVAAGIPLFRLRSEDPAATTVDEWYSLLTDEVLDKIDCGERIRIRDGHTHLVPLHA
ncbi:MAG: DUF2726 domain-containing protein [Betaproteobacteria bacterium]|nr:DUF2726 domain-containing protein [Betaproteobacteria bacterium]MDE2153151.1 DUF2726 domain-containing protein [Betaproteobacteria bacterium]MDE2478531.1 DUF2726 domain-containing protein [Betaproteobacteria bacterium]